MSLLGRKRFTQGSTRKMGTQRIQMMHQKMTFIADICFLPGKHSASAVITVITRDSHLFSSVIHLFLIFTYPVDISDKVTINCNHSVKVMKFICVLR